MLNYIWLFLILVSFVCAIFTGRMEYLSTAVMEGAGSAVSLVISTAGMMCLWTGLMRVAEAGGITTFLARILAPVLRRLFPDCKQNGAAMKAICMNVTANFLGLGNAATPFGLTAMRELQNERLDHESRTASSSMVLFVVLNTASIQLIPTFLGTIRAQYGSDAPFSVMVPIWITSAASLVVGLLAVKIFAGKCRQKTEYV